MIGFIGIVMNMQMKILNICSAVKQSDGGFYLILSKRRVSFQFPFFQAA